MMDLAPGFEISQIPVNTAPALDSFNITPVADDYSSYERSGFLGWLDYNLDPIDLTGPANYSGGKFIDHTLSIGWDVAAVYGLTTAFGLSNWEWGDSGFQVKSEGWFGDDTKYAGVDKLGHAYTAYLLSDYFAQRIAHSSSDPSGANVSGALLSMGVMTYIEIFDGFSGGHGFSPEDFVADASGALFSYVRSAVPGLADKIDYRMEYIPSGEVGFSPATDYAGQKYVLALKLAGFDEFKESPLRFFELQAGYYARGYTDEGREEDEDQKRETFVAVGLNLNEILRETPLDGTIPGKALRNTLHYVQVPYTYVPTGGY
ncbi:MAG: YfiM family protein [Proteobacteria bacterium]|nr:YfiM family protein [Pseudomonadota bacterium]